MSNDRINELPIAPLRAVLCRKFVAYEGAHITLRCGHTLVRTRDTHHRQMRCPECLIEGAPQ
jgi:hypothetical protein